GIRDFHVTGVQTCALPILITLIGSYLVIAGSGSLNNYIDRDIDILMRRTKRRPSVSGRFSPRFILALGSSYVTIGNLLLFHVSRSEERRVGKECSTWWEGG